MRAVFAFIFVVLAFPAFAQQERECRGKKSFELSDGTYGCLLEVGTTSITTTKTRDDNASSSVSSNVAGRIVALMFGPYNGSKRVTSGRIKSVCKTFLPDLKAATADVRYHRIVVQLVWPRVANPGDFVDKSRAKVAIQPAFSSSKCSGVVYFDR